MGLQAAPRRGLLPSYMSNQLWQDLGDAIDEVFGQSVDPFFDCLKYIREAWPGDMDFDPYADTNSDLSTKINDRVMLVESDFDRYEITTNRQRLNQIGLRALNPSVLEADTINRLVQHTGMFWYYKGLGSFIDYLSFILNTEVKFINLWTTDYKNFVPEGSPAIGTPKWLGGSWYPTTHIDLDLSGLSLSASGIASIVALFYDLSNYNLVLRSVVTGTYAQIVPASQYTTGDDGNSQPVAGNFVGMGIVVDRTDYIGS